MTQPTPAPAAKPKGRDPFSAPLEEAHVREFFRRLQARPPKEQQAFVGKVNWNLLDATTENQLMAWLVTSLRSDDAARQDFALATLDKLPHHRRGRHSVRFQRLLGDMAPTLAERLQNVFGPVLGGAPKRSAVRAAAPQPAGSRPAAGSAVAAPPAPAQAPEPDLASLKAFFDKYGGGAR